SRGVKRRAHVASPGCSITLFRGVFTYRCKGATCMSQHDGLNRRAFLRTTGMTALAGAVGSGSAFAGVGRKSADASPIAPLADSTKFDFDTPYSRLGTESTKWDAALASNEMGTITAGMGIADMDFKCAPSITKALQERIAHENWGYLTLPKTFAEQIAGW